MEERMLKKHIELDKKLADVYGAVAKTLRSRSVFPRFWPVHVTRVEKRLGISDWRLPMKKLYRVVVAKEGESLYSEDPKPDEPKRQFFVEGATVLDVLQRLALMLQLAPMQRVEIACCGELLKEEEPDV